MTDMQAPVLPWLTPDSGALAPSAETLLDFMRGRSEASSNRAGRTTGSGLDRPPEPVESVRDLLIDGAAGPVPGRLYLPAGHETGPLLLWFHGGGFVQGGLDSHDVPLRALANRAACAVLAVAYRLAPAHPYPAAVHDAAAAIDWAFRHAAGLGLDPARIMVGGDSAGGNVATVGAMLSRDAGTAPLALQLLVYPDADARRGARTASWSEYDGIILDREGKEIVLDQYLPPGTDRDQPHVSPALAPIVALRSLPPTLVVTAEFDPQRDEGELYAARLRQAGVRVALVRYPGMVHGFLQMTAILKEGRALIEQLAATIRSI